MKTSPSKKRKPRLLVAGEYDSWGYIVRLFRNGQVIWTYSAGNNRQDSIALAIPGTAAANPLRELRNFCIRECHTVAAWRQATYGGVERIRT